MDRFVAVKSADSQTEESCRASNAGSGYARIDIGLEARGQPTVKVQHGALDHRGLCQHQVHRLAGVKFQFVCVGQLAECLFLVIF